MQRAISAALLLSSLLLTSACSLVFDTNDLVGEKGGGGQGGSGQGGSVSGGGGAGNASAGGSGGEGGNVCPCDIPGIIWVATSPDATQADMAIECPSGTATFDGALAHSVTSDPSPCRGSCLPVCSVQLELTDGVGQCDNGGDLIAGDNVCKTANFENDGEFLKAYIAQSACTATMTLVDDTRFTRATVCSGPSDSCSPPENVLRCVKPSDLGCDDPCFSHPRVVAAIDDTRECHTAPKTCGGPCNGKLTRFSENTCDAALESFTISNAHVCDLTPADKIMPQQDTYWRFDWDGDPCEVSDPIATGAVLSEQNKQELCCDS